MEGLKDKLNKTNLDNSNSLIKNSNMKNNLLELYKTMKEKGLLDHPSTQYTTLIGSEVTQVNISTPYNSKNTYSDQFRSQGADETLLGRTIDPYK